ncbi:Dynein light chain type 1, putative [Angomonas deanei]|uniref:Dynein light chain n=1 Tax=Angomonas deanei TaxID=59799 RepID=A0A7G2C6G9_9TRYP|nr:Dynein light chain type 1, putative [Angomonas deanei]
MSATEAKAAETKVEEEEGEKKSATLSPTEQLIKIIMEAQTIHITDTDMRKEKSESVVLWAREAMAQLEAQYYNDANLRVLQRVQEGKPLYDGSINMNNIYMNHFKELSLTLKKKLDQAFRNTWHVICGTSFGSNVTCDKDNFINFKVNTVYFLVLQSGPSGSPRYGRRGWYR